MNIPHSKYPPKFWRKGLQVRSLPKFEVSLILRIEYTGQMLQNLMMFQGKSENGSALYSVEDFEVYLEEWH